MLSKAEYLHLKVKRDQLNDLINKKKAQWEAERQTGTNKNLSAYDRHTFQNAWNEYYEAVRKGYRAQTLYELKRMYVEDEKLNIKAYIQEKTQDPRWLENIPKPKCEEPSLASYFENGLSMDISRLAIMDKQLEEHSTVYGGKKESYDL